MGALKRLLTVLTLIALLAALACALFACGGKAPSSASLPPEEGADQLLLVAENAEHIILSWRALEADARAEADMMVEMAIGGPTARLSIGQEEAGGIAARGMAGSAGQNLADGFNLADAFDEARCLVRGYYVQISAVDMDGDATPEVIACVGNKATGMQALFYRYTGGDEPFTLVGVVDGQIQITVEGDTILVPHTDPALGVKYLYTPDGIAVV